MNIFSYLCLVIININQPNGIKKKKRIYGDGKDLEVDTLLFVKEYKSCGVWGMAYFTYFEDGLLYCFEHQQKSDETKQVIRYAQYSFTNPLV